MKKSILILFFILTAFSVSAADNISAVIRELSGTVELKAAGAQSFVQAKPGDRLRENTVISTGFKSTALVEVGSTIITVRPLTRLTLTEIHSAAGTETLNVNLQAGRLRVDVNPPSGTRAAMSVTSPIATASVRGTSVEIDLRNIHVYKGRVSFRGEKGSPRLLDAGSASTVEGNGAASDPVQNRTAGLIPKAPAGTDSSGGSSGKTPASTSGAITIHLNYGAPR